jgi:hypothetical protein
METKLIERVAQAIYEAEEKDFSARAIPWLEAHEEVRDEYRDIAEVALETMRRWWDFEPHA